MSRVIFAALTVTLAACTTAPTSQGGKLLTLADAGPKSADWLDSCEIDPGSPQR